MEKSRLPKGEKYWYITLYPDGTIETEWLFEEREVEDNNHYRTGNYFTTKESAESMARKLRAVLKGADVIEMPGADEIKNKSINIAIGICGDDYWRDCEEAVIKAFEWLKSKIVK